MPARKKKTATKKTATKKTATKKTAPKKAATRKTATKKAATAPDDDALPRVMGNPARNALAVEGVTTLTQAMRWSAAELLALHGVGPRAVAVLVAALSARGRSLRG